MDAMKSLYNEGVTHEQERGSISFINIFIDGVVKGTKTRFTRYGERQSMSKKESKEK